MTPAEQIALAGATTGELDYWNLDVDIVPLKWKAGGYRTFADCFQKELREKWDGTLPPPPGTLEGYKLEKGNCV